MDYLQAFDIASMLPADVRDVFNEIRKTKDNLGTIIFFIHAVKTMSATIKELNGVIERLEFDREVLRQERNKLRQQLMKLAIAQSNSNKKGEFDG